LERKVKTLHNNPSYEYLFDMFKEFCEEKGAQRQLAIPRTLE